MATPDMCQNISNQTSITFESHGSTAESTPDLRPRSEVGFFVSHIVATLILKRIHQLEHLQFTQRTDHR